MKRKLISFLITIVLIMGILPLTVTAAGPFTLEAPTNLTANLKRLGRCLF